MGLGAEEATEVCAAIPCNIPARPKILHEVSDQLGPTSDM